MIKKTKAVIVFVKYPELGKVKTRLASTTNNNFAVELYQIIASNIFEEISKLSREVEVFVFYSKIDEKSKVVNWINKDFIFLEQEGADLGKKMLNAFNTVFLKGFSESLIIGTDVPEMKVGILEDAIFNLANNDVVIAPSNDGGYSLLGMKENHSFLFENIEWSTNSVYINTYLKMRQNNLSFKKLNTLNDIDTKNDLSLWINSTQNISLKKKVKDLAIKEGVSI